MPPIAVRCENHKGNLFGTPLSVLLVLLLGWTPTLILSHQSDGAKEALIHSTESTIDNTSTTPQTENFVSNTKLSLPVDCYSCS